MITSKESFTEKCKMVSRNTLIKMGYSAAGLEPGDKGKRGFLDIMPFTWVAMGWHYEKPAPRRKVK